MKIRAGGQLWMRNPARLPARIKRGDAMLGFTRGKKQARDRQHDDRADRCSQAVEAVDQVDDIRAGCQPQDGEGDREPAEIDADSENGQRWDRSSKDRKRQAAEDGRASFVRGLSGQRSSQAPVPRRNRRLTRGG